MINYQFFKIKKNTIYNLSNIKIYFINNIKKILLKMELKDSIFKL